MFNGERWMAYMKKNMGKVIGALVGLIFGILVLSVGFWRSILLFIFIGAGYWLGNKIDSGKNFNSVFDRFNRDHRDNW